MVFWAAFFNEAGNFFVMLPIGDKVFSTHFYPFWGAITDPPLGFYSDFRIYDKF